MQWIQDHQAIMLLAWPLLTAILSLAYTRLDKSPRWHAFFSALASVGIDLPKLVDAIGRIVTGKTPPSSGGNLVGRTVAIREKVEVKGAGDLRKLLAVVGLAMTASGCSWLQSPQGTGTVQTTIVATICVLNHSQESIDQIIKDCGQELTSDIVTKILDAHRAAEIRERYGATDGGKP